MKKHINAAMIGNHNISLRFLLIVWFLDIYVLFESMEMFFLGQDFAIKLYLQPPVDVVTTANRKCAYMKHYGFSLLLGYLPPNMFK